MGNDKVITVFKNKDSLIDYDHGYEESANYITIFMSDAEYRENERKLIFDAINESCDLLIDNYESEVISGKDVDLCLHLCKIHAIQEDSAFLKALTQAKEYGFGLALDF